MHYAFLLIIFTLLIHPLSTNITIYNNEHIYVQKLELMDKNNIVWVPYNYSSLEEAIQQAKPGTIIYIVNGTYLIDSIKIRGKRDISIIGVGTVVLKQKTQVTNISLYSSTIDLFSVFNSSNIEFKNIILYSRLGSVIEIGYSQNISIINVTLYGTFGITIDESTNILVDNSYINGTIIPFYTFLSCNITVKNTKIIASHNTRPSSIFYSMNVTFENNTFLNASLTVSGYSIQIIRNNFIKGGLYITYNPKYVTIKDSYVNNKPLVFIKDRNLANVSLKKLYPEVGEIILFNVSNIVIKGYEISDTFAGLTIIESNNVTISDLILRNIIKPLTLHENENISLKNIVVENITETMTTEILDVRRTTNLVIKQFIVQGFRYNRSLNEYLEDAHKLVFIGNSKNVLIENSILPQLFLNAFNVTIRNTYFTTDVGLVIEYFSLIKVYSFSGFKIEPYMIDKLREILDHTELLNVSVRGKPVVFLKNADYNWSRIRTQYPDAAEIILYKVKHVIIDGYHGFTGKYQLVILDSRDIEIYNVSITSYMLLVNSRNVEVYLSSLYTGSLVVFNSTTQFFSKERIIYMYKGRIFYGKIGNYWHMIGHDTDNDGVSETPFIFKDFIDPYPLMKPPREYKVIGPISRLVKIIYPRNNSILGLTTHVHIIVDYPLNLNIIVTDFIHYKVDIAQYYNISGDLRININLSDVEPGYKYLVFKFYIDDYRDKPYRIYIPVFIDNKPPIVNITEPLNNTVVYAGKLTIKWVIEESFLKEVILYIDGKPVNVTGTDEYLLNVNDLPVGRHNITLVAIDKAGNIGCYTIFIEKKGIGPFNIQQGLLLIVLIITVAIGVVMLMYRRRRESGPAGI